MRGLIRISLSAVCLSATALLAAEPEAAAPAVQPETKPVEESCPVSFTATVDLYSAYVWRGMILSDKAVMQPGAVVAYDTGDFGTLAAGAWANMDLDSPRSSGTASKSTLSEVDYFASWAKDIGSFSVEVGYTYYDFSDVPEFNVDELYGKIAYNNDFVTPYMKHYWGITETESMYYTFGLTRSFEITDKLSAGFDAVIGIGSPEYVRYYFPPAQDGTLTDATAKIFASYALTDNLSIGATLAVSGLLDGCVVDAADDYYANQNDQSAIVWGGINLVAGF